MNADESNLADAEAALFKADRDLGRKAFEVVIAPRFPEFTELVHTGVNRDEPHLILRGDGNSFLAVETEISDPLQAREPTTVRQLSDGRTFERGTREYLLDSVQTYVRDQSLASAIVVAMRHNRVRYILVTVELTGQANKREVESLELSEFDI